MPITVPDLRTVLVPLFLVAQVILVRLAASEERPPAPPDFSSFPSGVGEWKQLREDRLSDGIAAELRADRLLIRTYLHKPEGSVASLFVAWFQSQRAGTSQPHSPKVCLPASGWTPALSGEITLNTTAGAITVNQYIVVNGQQRDVVLYWYQAPRRVTAGEWAAKFWLVIDALRDKRTDTALIRVVVPSNGGGDRAATAAAVSFGRSLYPLLWETLPKVSAASTPP